MFSRDCLEVDVRVNGRVLTILANHLKAQDRDVAASRARRRAQAERVAQLVHAAVAAGKLPVVLGDLNADPAISTADKSLDPLLKHPELKDPIVDLIPPPDRWTHFYDSRNTVSRLDYILPHESLVVTGARIVRNGLSTKCVKYPGPRFPTVAGDHTEASDHCPVSVTLKL